MRFVLSTFLVLLLLADLVLCYRGVTNGDTLLYSWRRDPNGFQFIQLWTARGGLRLMHGEEFTLPEGQQLLSWTPGFQHGTFFGPSYPYDRFSEGKSHHFMGFEFWSLDSSYPHLDRHFKSITFPHVVLIVLLVIYPLRFARGFRRTRLHRRRFKLGLCIQCGYDLRAAQERCPECGAIIPRDLQLT